jgi:hypothetical protein
MRFIVTMDRPVVLPTVRFFYLEYIEYFYIHARYCRVNDVSH